MVDLNGNLVSAPLCSQPKDAGAVRRIQLHHLRVLRAEPNTMEKLCDALGHDCSSKGCPVSAREREGKRSPLEHKRPAGLYGLAPGSQDKLLPGSPGHGQVGKGTVSPPTFPGPGALSSRELAPPPLSVLKSNLASSGMPFLTPITLAYDQLSWFRGRFSGSAHCSVCFYSVFPLPNVNVTMPEGAPRSLRTPGPRP